MSRVFENGVTQKPTVFSKAQGSVLSSCPAVMQCSNKVSEQMFPCLAEASMTLPAHDTPQHRMQCTPIGMATAGLENWIVFGP